MKKPIFDKSASLDERVEKLETVTKRLMRRQKKQHAAIITPYPISSAVISEDVQGVILRYMFPSEGTITKAALRLNKRYEGVEVRYEVDGEMGGIAAGIKIHRALTITEPALPVHTGDTLTVILTNHNGEKPILEAWVCFLWVPNIPDAHIKNFLAEEIESDLLQEGY